MFPTGGYDRAITVFSPEGRIFQVEYAKQMVNQSPSAVGVETQDGIILAGVERRLNGLQDVSFSQKLFPLDEHIGSVVSGFSSDARILIDTAREYAQINRLIYDEPIDIAYLVKRLSLLMQQYTQHAGLRPFGVSLIIGGVDATGPTLYQIDPSGIYIKYFATAIGVGSSDGINFLRKKYGRKLSLEEGIKLALDALKACIKDEFDISRIRMAQIKVSSKKYEELPLETIKNIYGG